MEGITINDVIGVIRRRWYWYVAAVGLCTTLSVMVALALPATYRSTARILVESQQIPSDLARSTVTSDPSERIQLIEQRLMARDNLLDLAERFNVFEGRETMSPSDVVAAMREATDINSTVLAAENRGRGPVSVATIGITFTADRPQLTSRIANELVSMVLEQNIRQRNEQAQGTLTFFTREAERLSGEMTAMEERIAAFKNANEFALPDSLEFRRTELANLDLRAFERERQRVALEERRRALVNAIANGAVSVGSGSLTLEEQELQRLRSALAQQASLYAATHPTIRSLTARIRALEVSIAGDAAQTAEQGVADAEAERDRTASGVERELQAVEAQITLLDRQRETEEARRAKLVDSIEKTPAVEIELNSLQRQYLTLELQHQQAVLKRGEAEVGERLEANRQAERFEVIEQALTPDAPVSPNRPLIAAAGFVAGNALGVGLMLLFELLNRSLRTARDVERRLEMAPIAVIPYVSAARETTLRRWRWRGGAAATLLGGAAALYAIDQLYLPLPLLAEKLMDASGLTRIMTLLGII
ncbi:GumC family protein [Rubrimonas cliftonensis]|uniref:Uncharacterized protein involved in exopolysaccharide biosynthesis n=1 Tax=Rubrimonas cliftonensis TaxID=89524 RepID=A0A1H4CV51_9RHOB|nr:Wzz/FepE/Etk N-terminal domain-containing protein [Rubrimonas cliftonensis]SEA64228.1 Uncharacterized protein involved in exopolysaccharide biosynthesis [Rubrimonas cliftonensis]